MIGLISPDRWTCPQCGRTETPHAGDGAAMRRAIRRAQERHTRRHARVLAAARAAVDLPLPHLARKQWTR